MKQLIILLNIKCRMELISVALRENKSKLENISNADMEYIEKELTNIERLIRKTK